MSEKINDGGPAFPVTYVEGLQGMSLRDWFAGKAMMGWIASFGPQDGLPSDLNNLTSEMYRLADAMLAERQRTR